MAGNRLRSSYDGSAKDIQATIAQNTRIRVGMPSVGLWLAVAVVMFAPAAARADGIDHAGATVLAQISLPSAVPAPAVRGLLVSGADVTAPIILDGTTLFRIGAPLNPRVTQIPIATRMADVQTALEQLIAQESTRTRITTVFDPASLRVHARRAGETVVLQAVDAKHSAQHFVRDFLNGYLVLYEDHYVVGDYVTINAFGGTVEVLTLRMVQIRDTAGDRITIPHRVDRH